MNWLSIIITMYSLACWPHWLISLQGLPFRCVQSWSPLPLAQVLPERNCDHPDQCRDYHNPCWICPSGLGNWRQNVPLHKYSSCLWVELALPIGHFLANHIY